MNRSAASFSGPTRRAAPRGSDHTTQPGARPRPRGTRARLAHPLDRVARALLIPQCERFVERTTPGPRHCLRRCSRSTRARRRSGRARRRARPWPGERRALGVLRAKAGELDAALDHFADGRLMLWEQRRRQCPDLASVAFKSRSCCGSSSTRTMRWSGCARRAPGSSRPRSSSPLCGVIRTSGCCSPRRAV